MFVQKKKLVEHVLAMRANGGSGSEEEEEEEDEGDILQVPIEFQLAGNYNIFSQFNSYPVTCYLLNARLL